MQREEFERLGVVGDWSHPYTTMDYAAEAQIARELMKFAANGTLYRGSKPVMWSVVEKTALAEAEVEYEDYVSDQVWVKFPVKGFAVQDFEPGQQKPVARPMLPGNLSVVIWTTTPWTLPGNRAISFNPKISYGIYWIKDAPAGNWAKGGDYLLLADPLALEVMKQARVLAYERKGDFDAKDLAALECDHPLRNTIGGYGFRVPLLPGDHVTDDVGTGFVHTAPGHGREDFDIWTANAHELTKRGIRTTIPYTVDADGRFTDQAPGFTGKRVLTETGEKGDANEAVIKALIDAGMLIARGRLKHQYPHSWRSKKPVIFRNTPQWFIAMDKDIAKHRDTLRHRALAAIKATRWVPEQGENRITGMIESRPDWVISRQRAWGVPITLFIKEKPDGSVDILDDPDVNVRIIEAFEAEGADAWYKPGARERFLGKLANDGWQKVDDILDVWFDSGSTHAFVLEDPVQFPGSRRHQAQGRRRPRHRDVSRRLRPASRLVPVLALGKLRHPRPRAVRRRAHPRLRARRGRAQNVEVARQRHRAAGRDQRVRRRHPAHVGVRGRLLATTCASGRKSSKPPSRPTASCATRCAGCSAIWRISTPPSASRTTRCRSSSA